MEEINPWFEKNKREFPWRSHRTPYRVWISEIMLQQTRASVVVPYFLRWMEQFPNVKALYMAPISSVIKAWEGLGYYSRARNIHAAAKKIVEEFGGELPASRNALLSLPGFGSYTAGAVLSFGFQIKSPAVDGNVLRVLSRYFLIEEVVSRASVRKKIEALAESVLDPDAPWISSEALIELGATVCLPNPRCEDCPIQKGCQALQLGKAHLLPIKKIEAPLKILHRRVFIIEHEGSVLLKRGEAGKVMADLFEFPYREMTEKQTMHWKDSDFLSVYRLKEESHTFTRFKAILYPIWIQVKDRANGLRLLSLDQKPPQEQWYRIELLNQLPFSSGHRKIKEQILLMKGLK